MKRFLELAIIKSEWKYLVANLAHMIIANTFATFWVLEVRTHFKQELKEVQFEWALGKREYIIFECKDAESFDAIMKVERGKKWRWSKDIKVQIAKDHDGVLEMMNEELGYPWFVGYFDDLTISKESEGNYILSCKSAMEDKVLSRN
eukprot:TRINITY_DN3493_c0_g1_i1.p1 TRINITY_DN3493_c0_g1~~TRINITY_DN3493_c0_g1_i1.p1  ORF type:complete len:147 (+),score=21.52 TRINITY_DN3493_c0_g1_i1:326-766(+)